MKLTLSFILLTAYCLVCTDAARVQPLRRFRDASKSLLLGPHPAPIYNNQWNDFYINVALGNPSLPFNLVVDTDWSGIWVPGLGCTDGHGHGCGKVRKFDTAYSSTFHSSGACKFQVDFIAGSGLAGQDQIGLAGINVKNQSFCVAKTLNVGSHLGLDIDGIIGLSPDSSNSLLQNMAAQQLIERQLYTLYLSVDQSVSPSGELTFGTIDKEYFEGEISYVPIVNDSRWQFTVDSLNITNQTYSENFEAAIATRSSYIAGPEEEIRALNEKLGFELIDETYGGVFFGAQDCDYDKLPNIDFTIGGQRFTLTPRQYVMEVDPIDTNFPYFSAFKLFDSFDHPIRDSWTFGTPFIQSVFTVFDQANKKIGFAHRKN